MDVENVNTAKKKSSRVLCLIPSTRESEVRGPIAMRPAWATECDHVSTKRKNKERKRKMLCIRPTGKKTWTKLKELVGPPPSHDDTGHKAFTY